MFAWNEINDLAVALIEQRINAIQFWYIMETALFLEFDLAMLVSISLVLFHFFFSFSMLVKTNEPCSRFVNFYDICLHINQKLSSDDYLLQTSVLH